MKIVKKKKTSRRSESVLDCINCCPGFKQQKRRLSQVAISHLYLHQPDCSSEKIFHFVFKELDAQLEPLRRKQKSPFWSIRVARQCVHVHMCVCRGSWDAGTWRLSSLMSISGDGRCMFSHSLTSSAAPGPAASLSLPPQLAPSISKNTPSTTTKSHR